MKLKATLSLYGYGTSEGVTKSWDTRGRSNHPELVHGVHLGIFDRPERPNQYARSVSNYFQQPVPGKPERERVARAFQDAVKIGKKWVNLSELTPMQATLVHSRVARIKEKIGDPEFRATKVPAVFRFEGKQYIMDGHHRLAFESSGGMSKSEAHVYTMPRVNRA